LLQDVQSQIRQWVDELQYERLSEIYAKVPSGKRVRAMLVETIAGVSEDSIKLASIIEMVHAASLLHDDVIDDAMTRRGEASINATEGSKVSIMIGDILYAKAFAQLAALKDYEIASIISSAVALLSVGELMDVEMAKKFNSSVDSYTQMIYNKTAVLIEATCKSAALLAKKESTSYAQYGKNIGLAFQIIDDILDVTSDEKSLGKPVMNDFVEGKTTLPYIFLHEELNVEEKEKLVSLCGVSPTQEQHSWLKEKFAATGAIERSKDEAKRLSDEAYALMSGLGEDELASLAQSLMERSA